MAKLIDAGVEATESIIRTAHKKAKKVGSWYALNDPSFDAREQVDNFASQKIADDLELERSREEFSQSLSAKSRRLRKAWQHLARAPEMCEEEDIQAARKAYEASLTAEQRTQEKDLMGLKDKHRTARKTKRLLSATDEEGDTDHILRTFHSILDAPLNHEHATMLPAVEHMMYRMVDILESQYANADFAPIANIRLDVKQDTWQVLPAGNGREKDFDMQRLKAIMQTQVAAELADPAPWKRVTTPIRGISMPAIYIEGQEGDKSNMHANIADAMCDIPGMKGKIVHVYKIDGSMVNETAYKVECNKRKNKPGPILGNPDYSGLMHGTLLIGPEAEALLHDWTGVDVLQIKSAPKRER